MQTSTNEALGNSTSTNSFSSSSSLLAELIFDGDYVELTEHEREIFVDFPSRVEE